MTQKHSTRRIEHSVERRRKWGSSLRIGFAVLFHIRIVLFLQKSCHFVPRFLFLVREFLFRNCKVKSIEFQLGNSYAMRCEIMITSKDPMWQSNQRSYLPLLWYVRIRVREIQPRLIIRKIFSHLHSAWKNIKFTISCGLNEDHVQKVENLGDDSSIWHY